MSRRKVKKGRFLDKPEAERQMEVKLNQQVSDLENVLTTRLKQRQEQEAIERTGTAQGILAADRESRLAGVTDYGIAKNVATTAQLVSNAVADATTGRRLAAIDEAKGDIQLAGELSDVQRTKEGYELGKVKQEAQVALGSAIAEERGDAAKQGALYSTVLGGIKGYMSKEPEYGVNFDPSTQEISIDKLGMNFTGQPGQTGSGLGIVQYAPKSVKDLDVTFGGGLAFGGSKSNLSRV